MNTSGWAAYAAALWFLCSGCAHTPTPEEKRSAYFVCADLEVNAAAANLLAAGYPIGERREVDPVDTGWIEVTLDQDDQEQSLSLRLDIRAAGKGTIFAVSEASPEGEHFWRDITADQVAIDARRALLNKLRRDICGDRSDYFGVP